eukprot:jgi/Mesen1/500/ME000104S10593
MASALLRTSVLASAASSTQTAPVKLKTSSFSKAAPTFIQFPHQQTKPMPSLRKENGSSSSSDSAVPDAEAQLAFVYGTLKHGFSNHWLMEEQIAHGNCTYIGTVKTRKRFPLVCGPFQVPFLLHMPGMGHQVVGELYQVNGKAVKALDDLEGTDKGHYMRMPLQVTGLELSEDLTCDEEIAEEVRELAALDTIRAEAYFAALQYTPDMARSASDYIESYSAKEFSTYTKRAERPRGRTFLEHIHHWIAQRQGVDVQQDSGIYGSLMGNIIYISFSISSTSAS